MSPKSAIVLLNKESGITSFSSLSPLKKTIHKKVGHAGTLDKFASGLLIALTGSFTRLNSLFSSLDKKYIATIKFGEESETLDPEGDIIARAPLPTKEALLRAIETKFIGTIEQVPPIYSALHIDGKRAYQLARSGKEVEMKSRPVTLYGTTLEEYTPPYATLSVHCSKGTYIRSIARDLALEVNSRGYLVALKRTHIGPYSLSQACGAKDTEQLIEATGHTKERLLALDEIGEVTLHESTLKEFSYGKLFDLHDSLNSTLTEKSRYAIVTSESGEMRGVVELNELQRPSKIVSLIPKEEWQ